jgi:hypothetical protein
VIPALLVVGIVAWGFLRVCRFEDEENARFMDMMRARFGDGLED